MSEEKRPPEELLRELADARAEIEILRAELAHERRGAAPPEGPHGAPAGAPAEAASGDDGCARSDFLAKMSHDIRTPLNGILGMTELALLETASPKVREYLSLVKSSARSLLEVLSALMNSSLLDARRLERPRAEPGHQTIAAAGRPKTGEPAAGPAPAANERVPQLPPAGPLRVLLAEDNPVNQVLGREILERAGHEVVVVPDGEQALNALRRGRFDVVLMDVEMPGVDGLEATRRIRGGEAAGIRRDIPIVALTAHALQGDRERFTAAGMDDYVSKPISLEEVYQALARVAGAARVREPSG
jgi:CheY-like chemotaxis protein